jgi:hypothetical protein
LCQQLLKISVDELIVYWVEPKQRQVTPRRGHEFQRAVRHQFLLGGNIRKRGKAIFLDRDDKGFRFDAGKRMGQIATSDTARIIVLPFRKDIAVLFP